VSLISFAGKLKCVGRVLQIHLVAKFIMFIWSFIMANEYHMHYVVSFKEILFSVPIQCLFRPFQSKKNNFQNISLMEFNCRIEPNKIFFNFFFLWLCGPTWAMISSFLRFLDHTQRCITVGRTPLDEWSARRRDLYMTTHNTHNRQTFMPPVGFETTISVGERPQIYALERAATLIGELFQLIFIYK